MKTQTYKDLLETFSAITLNQLNAQASLMNRIESKYLIHQSELGDLLKELQRDFSILEIGGKKIFSYENIYMDTKDLAFYHAHNNGDSDRIKMRTRHYLESGVSYFEFKQKKANVMRKFRYNIPLEMHGVLDRTAYEFMSDVYRSLYQEDFAMFVFPSLKTKYQRCSLVHKETAEKITIDFNISAEQVRESSESFDFQNLVIVEFKAEKVNSPTKNIFDEYSMRASKPCSKYCLGNYFLGNVKQRDRFQNTIDTIKAIIYSDAKMTNKSRKQFKKFQTTQLKKMIQK